VGWVNWGEERGPDASGQGARHVRPEPLESGIGAEYVWPERRFWW
jgi:hypothetical protein